MSGKRDKDHPEGAPSPGFEDIDALLDQALSLPENAREVFFQNLEPDTRAQVRKLLELSEELTLDQLSLQAASTLEDLAGVDVAETPATTRQWRLHRELGSGGMGQVFFATRGVSDPEPGGSATGNPDYEQEAAVKVLWSVRSGAETQARFFRERRILASFDHPGISRFLDGGFLADGRPWFAMEFVDGTDVLDYVRGRSVEEKLTLFTSICAAVAYAHEHLIVHRDIKPQNILVDREGRPRLLDFGVAGILDDTEEALTRTRGSPLTLQYASPEQVTGERATVASDIYQLGLLLYEMLTDERAHRLGDQPLQEAIRIIRDADPPAPSSLASNIGPDLDAIVSMALEKAPRRRYRSASALAEDVQRYLDGRPVQAVPHSRWYVARRFLRRNALLVAIVAVSVTALAGATLVSLQLAKDARDEARRSAITQQILSDVFQEADPLGESGADVTLAEALARAQPGIEAQIADDPVLAWEVNATLGEIYESLGLSDQEAQAYRAMIEASEAMGEGSAYRRLVGVAGYGSTLARSDPSAAVTWFSEQLPSAPADQEQVLPWLSAQYAYVGALNRLRDYEALDVEALRMRDVVDTFEVTNPRTLGRLSQQLANVARRHGDRAAEEGHWQDAVDHMRQADSPAALAVTLNNQAIFLGRNGRYEESEAAFLEAISVYEDAGHEDDSLAGVLRGYGGLQFRMGQADAAIATTQRSLSLLQSPSEAYARFITSLNLVRYQFVAGELEPMLPTMIGALQSALSELGADSQVPLRMRTVFAKTLVFAGDQDNAARTLGFASPCGSSQPYLRALDALEHPSEQEDRAAIWAAVEGLKAAAGSAGASNPQQVLAVAAERAPFFFDVLDQWRVLDAFAQAGDSVDVPKGGFLEYEDLIRLRVESGQRIRENHATAVAELASWFQSGWETPRVCPEPY